MKIPREIADRGTMRMIYSDKNKLTKTKSGKWCYIHKEKRQKATIICVPPKGKEIDDLAEYNARLLGAQEWKVCGIMHIYAEVQLFSA